MIEPTEVEAYQRGWLAAAKHWQGEPTDSEVERGARVLRSLHAEALKGFTTTVLFPLATYSEWSRVALRAARGLM